MHSDPLADLLTRVRNGCRARLPRVDAPWSRLKVEVLEILKREGFISDYREIAGKTKGQGVLEVKLRYDDEGQSLVGGVQSISTPGSRRYYAASEIPKVRNGLGIMILTTSRGLMTDREARASHVGGEALCSVW